jgi:hypothetical protein
MVMRSDFCILRTTTLELRVGKAYIGPSFKVGRGYTDGQHICCPRNYYGPSPCSLYVLFVQHTIIRSYIQLLGISHCIALPHVLHMFYLSNIQSLHHIFSCWGFPIALHFPKFLYIKFRC